MNSTDLGSTTDQLSAVTPATIIYSEDVDQSIKITIRNFFIVWMSLMLLVSCYTYTANTKLFVNYVKFTNPKDHMGEKFYNCILQNFAIVVQPYELPEYILQEFQYALNNYYVSYFRNQDRAVKCTYISDSSNESDNETMQEDEKLLNFGNIGNYDDTLKEGGQGLKVDQANGA